MMKILPRVNTPATGNATALRSPTRVCMHVRERVLSDGRVLREATALLEEGFSVSIVDVEREQTRPAEEGFRGIHIKHLVKPHWHVPVRMPWRIVRAAEKFVASTLALMRVPADIYHAHDANALPACYAAALLHRRPLIFDAHELPLYELDRGHPRLLRGLLMHSDCAGASGPPSRLKSNARSQYPDV